MPLIRWLTFGAPLLLVAACAGDKTTAIHQKVSVPADVQSTVTCTSDGTSITVSGELALDGLGAEVVFRNNVKGTHENTQELAASTVLVGADESIAIPTQTEQGQPVADPVVSVQFLDADGDPIGGEVVLGSCDEGSLQVSAPVLIDATVDLTVAAAGCANHPGPTITLEGAVTFSGLQQRLIVRDGAEGEIAGEVTTSVAIVALEDGETLAIPKQPVRGGVGGNPHIWLVLNDGSGGDLTDEIYLGRCVQLAGGDEDGSDAEADGD